MCVCVCVCVCVLGGGGGGGGVENRFLWKVKNIVQRTKNAGWKINLQDSFQFITVEKEMPIFAMKNNIFIYNFKNNKLFTQKNCLTKYVIRFSNYLLFTHNTIWQRRRFANLLVLNFFHIYVYFLNFYCFRVWRLSNNRSSCMYNSSQFRHKYKYNCFW